MQTTSEENPVKSVVITSFTIAEAGLNLFSSALVLTIVTTFLVVAAPTSRRVVMGILPRLKCSVSFCYRGLTGVAFWTDRALPIRSVGSLGIYVISKPKAID